MMRRIVIPTLVLAVLCLCVAEVQAGSATNLLFPYEVNKLEDNDWETLVIHKGTPDNDLDVGEVLVAMLEIQDVRNQDESISRVIGLETFTAILVVEVGSRTAATGGGWDYTFVPYTAGTWASLSSPAGTLGLPNHVGTGTMGIMYSDHRAVTSDKFTSVGTDTVPLSLKAALETAHLNTATALWEFGFTGTSPASGLPVPTSDEFYDTWTRFIDVSDPDQIIDISASLGVTHYYPGSPVLLDHDFLYSGFNAAIQGQGGLGTGVRGLFPIVTDTDWYIKPTPEPASLALLGLGLAACGLVIRRRRK